MEIVKEGDHILYIWGGEINHNIEEQVNKLKQNNVKVNVENADRLSMATYKNSAFDIILSNLSSNNIKHTDELLRNFIKLVKPKGVVAIQDESLSNDEFSSKLKLNGFINIKFVDKVFQCEKPNYEIGSSKKLSFTNKNNAVKSVWKIDNNDNDDDIIDPDDLLDEDDLKKPNPTTLRVCGTTGKRKACKDCSCGLAEELDQENLTKSVTNETQKSSCGSCYLGDAFRCASCPYLGMPAFKPGEKIQLSDTQMKADI